jgi:hypothetical protein
MHDKQGIIRENFLLEIYYARAVVVICSAQLRGSEVAFRTPAKAPEAAVRQPSLRSVSAGENSK